MNRHEYHEALSSVRASDALLTQVLSLDEKKKPVINPWNTVRRLVAVAAVLAILLTALLWPVEEDEYITAPGVLRVYACDIDELTDISELEEYELTDAIDSNQRTVVPHLSGLVTGMCIPFTFQIDQNIYGDEEISFYVALDYGYIRFEQQGGEWYSRPVTVQNGDTIYWYFGSIEEADKRIGSCGKFYADVIIYAGEAIVGYGIINFVYYAEEGMLLSFVTTGCKTVCFPMVDGEYQDVSEEDVWRMIDEYKQAQPKRVKKPE